MPHAVRMSFAIAAAALAVGAQAPAQFPAEPLPDHREELGRKMPEGRAWGSTSAVDIDRGGHIWVAERCGANNLRR